MQIVYTGQSNIIALPLVAKASGDPITSGTVNFYLRALNGDNAGKWYRGSDQSWQSAESIAGSATHSADGHWELSLASGVWTKDVQYLTYGRESGNLHIPVEKDILCISEITRHLAARLFGNMRIKSGQTNVYEILDPDDQATVIAEVTLNQAASPYQQVTML